MKKFVYMSSKKHINSHVFILISENYCVKLLESVSEYMY